ncbi:MAG: DNA-protecting protein DprA [Leucobacter sp.]|nr:DNA-protecting protein DprA [Leucobacter sp.]
MVTITSLAKDERSARVALASTLEPDDAVTGRLLAAVGAVETVRLAAGAGALPKNVDAVEARLWRNKVAPRMDARTVTQALAETDRLGLRILIPSDDEWPTALNDLGNRAPTALWLRGAVSYLTAPLNDRVTITGARAATSYGEHVTGELASNLTHAERIIVAGGAYGIDAETHRAATAVRSGSTIAVLAGGVDRPYPAAHASLFQRIADGGGLLLSEVPPGFSPSRDRFVARARLMAALSAATVIPEATSRSGSLRVAMAAYDLGRRIGAVPGPITSAASNGCNLLLAEELAEVVTGAGDVESMLDPAPAAYRLPPAYQQAARRAAPEASRSAGRAPL